MLLGVNDSEKFNTITTRTITINRYIYVPWHRDCYCYCLTRRGRECLCSTQHAVNLTNDEVANDD